MLLQSDGYWAEWSRMSHSHVWCVGGMDERLGRLYLPMASLGFYIWQLNPKSQG